MAYLVHLGYYPCWFLDFVSGFPVYIVVLLHYNRAQSIKPVSEMHVHLKSNPQQVLIQTTQLIVIQLCPYILFPWG